MPKKVDLSRCRVLKQLIQQNRFILLLQNGDDKIIRMFRANYIWLKYNPSFKKIPSGYVVHHLDHDETNDDISNLALMARHYHLSYHFKNQPQSLVPVEVEYGLPCKEPTIGYKKATNRYRIRYSYRSNGRTKSKYVTSLVKGRSFRTYEEAEKAIDKLWPGRPWEADDAIL